MVVAPYTKHKEKAQEGAMEAEERFLYTGFCQTE
jgi:hypothetical protein